MGSERTKRDSLPATEVVRAPESTPAVAGAASVQSVGASGGGATPADGLVDAVFSGIVRRQVTGAVESAAVGVTKIARKVGPAPGRSAEPGAPPTVGKVRRSVTADVIRRDDDEYKADEYSADDAYSADEYSAADVYSADSTPVEDEAAADGVYQNYVSDAEGPAADGGYQDYVSDAEGPAADGGYQDYVSDAEGPAPADAHSGPDMAAPAPGPGGGGFQKYQKSLKSVVSHDEFTTGSIVLQSMVVGMKANLAAGKPVDEVRKAACLKMNWTEEEFDKHVLREEPGLVRKLNALERQPFEVQGGAGLFRVNTAGAKEVFDTGGMRTNQAGAGFGIFVMDHGGRIYSDGHKVGLFHHSSFLEGSDVAAAGEIQVVAGTVTWVTSKSGHYQGGPDVLVQFLQELGSRGQDLTKIPVTSWDDKKRARPIMASELVASGQFPP